MTSATRTLLGAAALLAVLIVTACGSTSWSAPAQGTSTAKTPPAVTTTAGVSPSTPSPTGPNYAQLAVDKLVDALPTLDDMPAGYTAETPETKDTNETFCNDKQPMSGRAVAESWSYWPTRLSSDITGSVTQAAKA